MPGKEHDTKISVDLHNREQKKDFKERVIQYDTSVSELMRSWVTTWLSEHPPKAKASMMVK